MYPESTDERLGVGCGAVLTILAFVLPFLGPWRMLALDVGGTIPIRALETGASGGPYVLIIAGAALFAAFVGGNALPMLAGEDEEYDPGDLGMGVFVPPFVLALVGFLLLMLTPAAGTLLAGAVGDAAASAVAGIVVAVLFAGTVGLVMAVLVGIPALVGAFAGTWVGEAAFDA